MDERGASHPADGSLCSGFHRGTSTATRLPLSTICELRPGRWNILLPLSTCRARVAHPAVLPLDPRCRLPHHAADGCAAGKRLEKSPRRRSAGEFINMGGCGLVPVRAGSDLYDARRFAPGGRCFRRFAGNERGATPARACIVIGGWLCGRATIPGRGLPAHYRLPVCRGARHARPPAARCTDSSRSRKRRRARSASSASAIACDRLSLHALSAALSAAATASPASFEASPENS